MDEELPKQLIVLMIRLRLEYAAMVWLPYLKKTKNIIYREAGEKRNILKCYKPLENDQTSRNYKSQSLSLKERRERSK